MIRVVGGESIWTLGAVPMGNLVTLDDGRVWRFLHQDMRRDFYTVERVPKLTLAWWRVRNRLKAWLVKT